MAPTSILKVLVDAAAYSEHDILIRSEIRTKSVNATNLDVLMWMNCN
jgi:hypothetical protein